MTPEAEDRSVPQSPASTHQPLPRLFGDAQEFAEDAGGGGVDGVGA